MQHAIFAGFDFTSIDRDGTSRVDDMMRDG
jgi:hypothetical protein